MTGDSMNSPITTHVLDTHLGKPAAGMHVSLYKKSVQADDDKAWQQIAAGETNVDGRILDWLAGQRRETGIYKISFDTDAYFEKQGLSCFYPSVSFEFRITHADEHYHVPLLISAHGMSTYRGS